MEQLASLEWTIVGRGELKAGYLATIGSVFGILTPTANNGSSLPRYASIINACRNLLKTLMQQRQRVQVARC